MDKQRNIVKKIEELKGKNLHLVEIVRVEDNASGFVRVVDSHCQMNYIVPYNLIENYKGEYAGELKQFSKKGLRKGLQVWIEFEGSNKIKAMYPYEKFEIKFVT